MGRPRKVKIPVPKDIDLPDLVRDLQEEGIYANFKGAFPHTEGGEEEHGSAVNSIIQAMAAAMIGIVVADALGSPLDWRKEDETRWERIKYKILDMKETIRWIPWDMKETIGCWIEDLMDFLARWSR